MPKSSLTPPPSDAAGDLPRYFPHLLVCSKLCEASAVDSQGRKYKALPLLTDDLSADQWDIPTIMLLALPSRRRGDQADKKHLGCRF